MNFKATCKFERKLSKEKKEYYTLYIEELGKTIFLDDTEVKLLKLLLGYTNKSSDMVEE